MIHTLESERFPSANEWQLSTLATLGNYSDLSRIPWDDLRKFEIFPNCRLGDDVLAPPEFWFASTARRLSFRAVRPAKAGVPADIAHAARCDEAIRRALLALWLPRLTETGVRQYKAISWIKHANLLLKLLNWRFQNLPSTDGSVFSAFTESIVERQAARAVTKNSRSRSDCHFVLQTLIDAGRRGIVSDWPQFYSSKTSDDGTVSIERQRLGDLPKINDKKQNSEGWQPFDDQFVTQFVRRTLWIHENLADQVLTLWAELREITATEATMGRKTAHPAVIQKRLDKIQNFRWTDKTGSPLASLPFALSTDEDTSGSWPPTSTRAFYRMVSAIQAMNCALLAFCTGARVSELSSAQDTDLQGSAGRLYSKVIKLVDDVEGKRRDWPLHPAAVRGLRIQQKLAGLVRREDKTHLWIILRDGDRIGQPLLNLTEPLVKAVDYLGLSGLTGTDRAHLHRWRHTVARLVALAVVGAPQVLLDLFGHRDLKMTLRYMLSDPELFEDAMRVAKEKTFAMVGEALGSGLIDHIQKMTAAAMQMADMKV
jgi:integrase